MTYPWAMLNYVIVILGTLPFAPFWHWMTTPGQFRRETFFGARVELDFPESQAGRAILSQFRWRIWGWALGLCAASLLVQYQLALGIVQTFFLVMAGLAISLIACQVAFGLAHGRTQREAVATAEPTVRMASLATHDKQPDSLWLGVLDWLAMLVPPLIPAVTLIFLAFHWNQFPSQFNEASSSVTDACVGLACGLSYTANQWALLYRARSSDWASTPGASHRYRTYLGLMQASMFTFLICNMCLFSVMPLRGSVAWLHHLNRTTNFYFVFLGMVITIISVWSLCVWLRKHLDRESSDPMADSYWKWGYFYFNPNDSAIMVPARTGIWHTPNLARPYAWVGLGVVIVLMVARWV